MKPRIRFGRAAVAALLCAPILLGGCSTVEKLTNKGGDTTCEDFNADDAEKQRSAVAKMLADKKGEEPTNLELSGTQLAVSAYCKTIGKDSDKISRAML